MSDCIFCKIVAGKIPAAKVYEDNQILVFLDINPVNYGHTLVIPKKHYQSILETPDDLVAYIFNKIKALMPAIKTAMAADYVAISIIGIDVPHFHVHLIPRHKNDGLVSWPTKQYNEGEIATVAAKIKNEIVK